MANISLIFLPGNHSLVKELHVVAANNFSMSTQAAEMVIVECADQLGRFNIRDITHVSVRGLHFVGCGGNRVSNVGLFIVEDTIFQGVEGGGTGLKLTMIVAASIIRSEFLSNGQQNYSTSHHK